MQGSCFRSCAPGAWDPPPGGSWALRETPRRPPGTPAPEGAAPGGSSAVLPAAPFWIVTPQGRMKHNVNALARQVVRSGTFFASPRKSGKLAGVTQRQKGGGACRQGGGEGGRPLQFPGGTHYP